LGMHLINLTNLADIVDIATTGITGTILFAKSWWLVPANLIALAKGIGGLGHGIWTGNDSAWWLCENAWAA